VADRTRRLLQGAQGGDDEARGALLERVRPRLLLWTTARLSAALRAKVEPEDVVQEVLVAVHKGLDGFQGDDDRAFLRWLFTIAENRIRDLADHFGAQKRQLPRPTAFSQTSPSSLAVRNEMALKVREALVRLSESHRQVIWMRRFEEREVPEIAAAMERSENAVRILYCRAIQALRDELADQP
jgi:RNA polymerase sigma-70 factor (ECF subfamily)